MIPHMTQLMRDRPTLPEARVILLGDIKMPDPATKLSAWLGFIYCWQQIISSETFSYLSWSKINDGTH